MQNLLNETIKKQVQDVFEQQLKYPVEILFFGSPDSCEYCEPTLQLAEEVSAISGKIGLVAYDIHQDSAIASQYHIEMVPSLVIAAREGEKIHDYGIRFAGIPAGHEFSSLIQSLILVSQRDSGLAPETRKALGELDKPVKLQVFSSPT